MKILAAFGIIDMSPFELSDVLRDLNLSHTCVWRSGLRCAAYDVDGLCKEQPAWPIIFDSIRSLSKLEHAIPNPPKRSIIFVADARAALSNTNIAADLWPENRRGPFNLCLTTWLRKVHKDNESWKLEMRNPSIMDYVNTAVNPSILNDLQSAFYRISNYAARKEIQKLCISWLSGTTSWSKIDKVLKSNIRYEKVYALMQSPLAAKLKEAVHQLKTGAEPADKVAKQTGFEPFELLYIVRSSASSDEKDKEAKAARK
jgi:hypothetical protein